MKYILKGIVGSHAYGLNTPDSDIDRAGVFVLPTKEFLGLKRPNETVHTVSDEADLTAHEVGKFIGLAIAANPTVMECLWLPEYEYMDEWGARLLAKRECFLSDRVRQTYTGYAHQQVTRLLNRGGTFDPDLKKRTAKHARHCTRLLIQVEHVMLTGEIQVRLTEDQAKFCRAMGALAESDHEAFATSAMERIDHLKGLPSTLPKEPDWDEANRVLLDIRYAHLD